MSENETNSSDEITGEPFWKVLVLKHWPKLIPFVVGIVVCCIGFILVFLWHMLSSPFGSGGTWTFNQWSFATVFAFVFWWVVWELLIVGLPAAVYFGALFGGIWYGPFLSETEKAEIKRYNDERERAKKQYKSIGGSGGFGFFVLLGVFLKAFIEGNWETQFAYLPFSYFAYSWIIVTIWIAIIFGIPLTIVGIIYLAKKL